MTYMYEYVYTYLTSTLAKCITLDLPLPQGSMR